MGLFYLQIKWTAKVATLQYHNGRLLPIVHAFWISLVFRRTRVLKLIFTQDSRENMYYTVLNLPKWQCIRPLKIEDQIWVFFANKDVYRCSRSPSKSSKETFVVFETIYGSTCMYFGLYVHACLELNVPNQTANVLAYLFIQQSRPKSKSRYQCYDVSHLLTKCS